MIRGASTSERVATWLAGATAVAIGLLRNAETVADHDLWGHLRFGLDKLDAGGYIASDEYSYLANDTWFNHEWGGEVLMALLYRTGGPGLLVMAKALLLGAVIVGLFRLMRGRGVDLVPSLGVSAVVAMLLAPTFGTFRPQIFTVGLMTVLLVAIVKIQDGDHRMLVVLPVLMAVWVNLHGGALGGLAVIGLWSLLRLRQFAGRRLLIVSAGASAAAFVLAHPLGPRHAWFLVTSTLERRPEILDWQPVALNEPVGVVYAVVLVATAALVWMRRSALEWPLVVPLLVLVLAPLSATRHLQLAAVAIGVLGALMLGRTEPAAVASRDVAVLAALAVVTVTAAVVQTGRAVDCLALDPTQFETPVAAVGALESVGDEANVIVPFNWGEYVIWELGPEYQVSVDGRRETVYSEAVLADNLAFERGTSRWELLLDRRNADAALLTSGSPTIELLESQDWTAVHRDPTAVLLVPPGSAVSPPASEAPHDGAGMCFPTLPDSEPRS